MNTCTTQIIVHRLIASWSSNCTKILNHRDAAILLLMESESTLSVSAHTIRLFLLYCFCASAAKMPFYLHELCVVLIEVRSPGMLYMKFYYLDVDACTESESTLSVVSAHTIRLILLYCFCASAAKNAFLSS